MRRTGDRSEGNRRDTGHGSSTLVVGNVCRDGASAGSFDGVEIAQGRARSAPTPLVEHDITVSRCRHGSQRQNFLGLLADDFVVMGVTDDDARDREEAETDRCWMEHAAASDPRQRDPLDTTVATGANGKGGRAGISTVELGIP